MKKDLFYKEIGKRIKKIRLEKGFTQEELALKSNLHRAYIGHIERGEKKVGVYNLYKVSKALEVKIVKLIPTGSS